MKRFFAGAAAALLAAVLLFIPAKAVSAEKAYVLDAVSGRVLFEKNADAQSLIASTTKIMTALIVCEQCNVLDRMRIPKEAVGIEGSSMYLKEGEELALETLLYGLMLCSGNDAAVAIASCVGGSGLEGVSNFVDMMNAKARSLGLTSTHFTNSTGLHNEEHYSTCREMAAIMAYALDNTLARRILLSTETKSFKAYKGNTDEKTVTYYASPDWYQTDGGTRFKGNVKLETVTVKGGKTGYTDEAGVCLVSYAESNSTGKCYINVIVGKPKGSGVLESVSTADVKCIYNTYAE